MYENDIRVPFCVRGPGIPANTTIPDRIVANVDIAPTILDVILDGMVGHDDPIGVPHNGQDHHEEQRDRLRSAMEDMSGLSFWKFLTSLGKGNGTAGTEGLDDNDTAKADAVDPFASRRDLLISYHGEGFPPCGMAECPPPYDGIWWMPDSSNNTYNCVRTLSAGPAGSDGRASGGRRRPGEGPGENTIYCRFVDDEDFVEYYDLDRNPYQMNNDYPSLEEWEKQTYERRLKELLLPRQPGETQGSTTNQQAIQ